MHLGPGESLAYLKTSDVHLLLRHLGTVARRAPKEFEHLDRHAPPGHAHRLYILREDERFYLRNNGLRLGQLENGYGELATSDGIEVYDPPVPVPSRDAETLLELISGVYTLRPLSWSPMDSLAIPKGGLSSGFRGTGLNLRGNTDVSLGYMDNPQEYHPESYVGKGVAPGGPFNASFQAKWTSNSGVAQNVALPDTCSTWTATSSGQQDIFASWADLIIASQVHVTVNMPTTPGYQCSQPGKYYYLTNKGVGQLSIFLSLNPKLTPAKSLKDWFLLKTPEYFTDLFKTESSLDIEEGSTEPQTVSVALTCRANTGDDEIQLGSTKWIIQASGSTLVPSCQKVMDVPSGFPMSQLGMRFKCSNVNEYISIFSIAVMTGPSIPEARNLNENAQFEIKKLTSVINTPDVYAQESIPSIGMPGFNWRMDPTLLMRYGIAELKVTFPVPVTVSAIRIRPIAATTDLEGAIPVFPPSQLKRFDTLPGSNGKATWLYLSKGGIRGVNLYMNNDTAEEPRQNGVTLEMALGELTQSQAVNFIKQIRTLDDLVPSYTIMTGNGGGKTYWTDAAIIIIRQIMMDPNLNTSGITTNLNDYYAYFTKTQWHAYAQSDIITRATPPLHTLRNKYDLFEPDEWVYLDNNKEISQNHEMNMTVTPAYPTAKDAVFIDLLDGSQNIWYFDEQGVILLQGLLNDTVPPLPDIKALWLSQDTVGWVQFIAERPTYKDHWFSADPRLGESQNTLIINRKVESNQREMINTQKIYIGNERVKSITISLKVTDKLPNMGSTIDEAGIPMTFYFSNKAWNWLSTWSSTDEAIPKRTGIETMDTWFPKWGDKSKWLQFLGQDGSPDEYSTTPYWEIIAPNVGCSYVEIVGPSVLENSGAPTTRVVPNTYIPSPLSLPNYPSGLGEDVFACGSSQWYIMPVGKGKHLLMNCFTGSFLVEDFRGKISSSKAPTIDESGLSTEAYPGNILSLAPRQRTGVGNTVNPFHLCLIKKPACSIKEWISVQDGSALWTIGKNTLPLTAPWDPVKRMNRVVKYNVAASAVYFKNYKSNNILSSWAGGGSASPTADSPNPDLYGPTNTNRYQVGTSYVLEDPTPWNCNFVLERVYEMAQTSNTTGPFGQPVTLGEAYMYASWNAVGVKPRPNANEADNTWAADGFADNENENGATRPFSRNFHRALTAQSAIGCQIQTFLSSWAPTTWKGVKQTKTDRNESMEAVVLWADRLYKEYFSKNHTYYPRLPDGGRDVAKWAYPLATSRIKASGLSRYGIEWPMRDQDRMGMWSLIPGHCPYGRFWSPAGEENVNLPDVWEASCCLTFGTTMFVRKIHVSVPVLGIRGYTRTKQAEQFSISVQTYDRAGTKTGQELPSQAGVVSIDPTTMTTDHEIILPVLNAQGVAPTNGVGCIAIVLTLYWNNGGFDPVSDVPVVVRLTNLKIMTADPPFDEPEQMDVLCSPALSATLVDESLDTRPPDVVGDAYNAGRLNDELRRRLGGGMSKPTFGCDDSLRDDTDEDVVEATAEQAALMNEALAGAAAVHQEHGGDADVPSTAMPQISNDTVAQWQANAERGTVAVMGSLALALPSNFGGLMRACNPMMAEDAQWASGAGNGPGAGAGTSNPNTGTPLISDWATTLPHITVAQTFLPPEEGWRSLLMFAFNMRMLYFLYRSIATHFRNTSEVSEVRSFSEETENMGRGEPFSLSEEQTQGSSVDPGWRLLPADIRERFETAILAAMSGPQNRDVPRGTWVDPTHGQASRIQLYTYMVRRRDQFCRAIIYTNAIIGRLIRLQTNRMTMPTNTQIQTAAKYVHEAIVQNVPLPPEIGRIGNLTPEEASREFVRQTEAGPLTGSSAFDYGGPGTNHNTGNIFAQIFDFALNNEGTVYENSMQSIISGVMDMQHLNYYYSLIQSLHNNNQATPAQAMHLESAAAAGGGAASPFNVPASLPPFLEQIIAMAHNSLGDFVGHTAQANPAGANPMESLIHRLARVASNTQPAETTEEEVEADMPDVEGSSVGHLTEQAGFLMADFLPINAQIDDGGAGEGYAGLGTESPMVAYLMTLFGGITGQYPSVTSTGQPRPVRTSESERSSVSSNSQNSARSATHSDSPAPETPVPTPNSGGFPGPPLPPPS